MKNVTAGIATALNSVKCNEPIIVLGIDWGTTVGAFFYADKYIVSPEMQGRILQLSNLSIVRHQDNFGEIASCSVVLSDHDLHFWQIMNQTNLEGKNVVVWQYFPNTDATELLCLFIGNIVAPIVWSEGEKTLSFSVFTNYNDKNVGITLTSDDLQSDINQLTVLDKSAIGQTIPLAFGNCLKTKALKTFTGRQSTLLENIYLDDNIFHEAFENDIPYISQEVQVDKGEEWPQGVEVSFSIDDINFKGIFTNNIVKITDSNVPTDLMGAVTYREPLDPDYKNYSVVWIPTNENLVNKWVWFQDKKYGNIINFCTNQNGYKCTFQQNFIREFKKIGDFDPSDADDTDKPYVVLMSGNKAIQCALKYSYKWPKLGTYLLYYEIYTIPIGSTLIVLSNEVYAVNSLAHSTIKNAYAFRSIPNMIYNPELDQYEQRSSTRKLCIIPSRYYTVDPVPFTTISFPRKLSSYQGEHWEEGEIFVTQSSPIGPNTAEIIQWILENHTTLVIDNASFDSVTEKLDKYPSNFVIHDSPKAIEVCKKIAWQARCALRIYNGTAYLLYLSEFPDIVATLTPDTIQYKSMEILYTDTERMTTRAKAKFTVPSLIGDNEEQTRIRDNNINAYGLKETTWDFFIYDTPAYVDKSLAFWLNYYSNSWKKIHLKGFLNSLRLELFDCVFLAMSNVYPLGISGCKGIVEEWQYNSDNFTVDLILWTVMLAGTQFESNLFWLDDSNDNIGFVDPTDGMTRVDYIIPIETKNRKHPNKYVKIKTVDPELDADGNPVIVENEEMKTYTAETMSHGPENGIDGSTVSGIRAIDPAQTALLPGDIVKINTLNGIPYLTNKTNDIVAFKFHEMHADYIAAYPADTGDHGTYIYIAKPFNLRRTPFDGQTINGITYAYTSDFRRTATDVDGNVEVQLVTPDYVDNHVIHAMRNVRGQDVFDVDGKPVKWLQTDVYQWAVFDD